MRILIYLLLIAIFDTCTQTHSNQENLKSPLSLQIINSKFPLRLTEIDWKNKKNIIRLNDGIEAKIEQTVQDYYSENNLPDSLIANYYLSTIRLHDSMQTVFLVLLRHPTGHINSKILFYDNKEKDFVPHVLDFNIFAMYDEADGGLRSSNLKNSFKIDTPEVQLVDFNADSQTDFQFSRLVHNGTFNAIQTTIVSVKNLKIDTLSTTNKPIGLYN